MSQIASGSEVLGRLEAVLVRKQQHRWIDLPSLGVGLLVLLGGLFYVWQHVQAVQLGYEIEQLKQERAAFVERERELTLEIARLKSPKRVEEIARDRLGFITPAPDQIVIVPQRP
ncbi:MAG: cell division protein FtsL [candidate division NC10 bacterium]|nr:cell division protein FtsL [candidate division NC10 bacterium]